MNDKENASRTNPLQQGDEAEPCPGEALMENERATDSEGVPPLPERLAELIGVLGGGVCPACEGRRVKLVLPRQGLVVAPAGESGVVEPVRDVCSWCAGSGSVT